MEKQIKWGVLGYAGIAKNHVLPAMLKASNACPYAIASRSEEKLIEAQKKFGFSKLYHSYDELLQDPAVQAVYIPLPNALHKEWTLRAARSGKHILCEKPLALTGKDCQEIFDVCREHHVKIMEAFMYRFTPRTKKVMELLQSGIIGEVRYIHSSHLFLLENAEDIRVNKALGGGSLRDVGCYPINIIGLITDSYPEAICALKKEVNGVDFSLTAVMRYPGGIMATASGGFDSQGSMLTEINGTKGCMYVRDSFQDTDAPIQVVSGEGGTVKEYPVEACDRYQLEVEHFSRAILEDTEPMLTAEETVRNNTLIEEILKIAQG